MKTRPGFLFLCFELLLTGCTGWVATATYRELTAASIASLEYPTASQTPFSPVSTILTFRTNPAATLTLLPTSSEEIQQAHPLPNDLTITIVYDNIPSDARLTTDWGFGALVEYNHQAVLFDSGANGPILLGNMQTLEIDPTRVKTIVLSHSHSDHIGGIEAFLAVSPQTPVYLLSSFEASFIRKMRQITDVIETTPGQMIAEGILTTGEVGGDIPEQALLIQSGHGLVVITGCAHPGIVRMIERAKELTGMPVYLVLGGFHLSEKSNAEIAAIIADFRRLGVQKVAPSHCTGAQAINMFAAEYGEDFVPVGAGSILSMGK